MYMVLDIRIRFALTYFLTKRHGFQAGLYYRAIVWINRSNINNSGDPNIENVL